MYDKKSHVATGALWLEQRLWLSSCLLDQLPAPQLELLQVLQVKNPK